MREWSSCILILEDFTEREKCNGTCERERGEREGVRWRILNLVRYCLPCVGIKVSNTMRIFINMYMSSPCFFLYPLYVYYIVVWNDIWSVKISLQNHFHLYIHSLLHQITNLFRILQSIKLNVSRVSIK